MHYIIYLGRILPEITPRSSLISAAEVSHLLHSSSQGNERETISYMGLEPHFFFFFLDARFIFGADHQQIFAKWQQLLCLQSTKSWKGNDAPPPTQKKEKCKKKRKIQEKHICCWSQASVYTVCSNLSASWLPFWAGFMAPSVAKMHKMFSLCLAPACSCPPLWRRLICGNTCVILEIPWPRTTQHTAADYLHLTAEYRRASSLAKWFWADMKFSL